MEKEFIQTSLTKTIHQPNFIKYILNESHEKFIIQPVVTKKYQTLIKINTGSNEKYMC